MGQYPGLEAGINQWFPSFESRHILDNWSSFPSDHAGLGFALAACIFMLNRQWGIFAYLHTLIIICIPRMYLSYHYPSDVLGGAVIGILSAWAVMKTNISAPVTDPVFAIEKRQPVIFYVLFLVMASQMIEMFEDLRHLVSIGVHVLKGLL